MKKNKNHFFKARLISLAIGFLAFSISLNLYAAKVTKVKGNRALVSLDGLETKTGDTLVAKDALGKNKAIMKVLSVKNGQAVVKLTRGSAVEGYSAVLSSSAMSKADKEMAEVPASSMSHFGVLGSYLINSMSAKFTVSGTSKTSNMSGTGFGLLGYYDYTVSDASQLRGSVGYEQFQVAENRATADCNNGTSTTCNVSINYLSMYGLYKYNFINGYTKAWFGGGGGLLVALSKSSSVLQTSDISTNSVLNIAFGLDMNMGKGQYLPLILEYSMFPASTTVSANFIALRFGWGWR